MSQYKCFAVQQHVDVTVVHLLDQRMLDRLMINELRDELLNLVDTRRPEKLLINFGGVTHLSSEAIGALLSCWKHLAENGGVMRLAGMNENVREVFRITRLEGRVFDIYDTADKALARF